MSTNAYVACGAVALLSFYAQSGFGQEPSSSSGTEAADSEGSDPKLETAASSTAGVGGPSSIPDPKGNSEPVSPVSVDTPPDANPGLDLVLSKGAGPARSTLAIKGEATAEQSSPPAASSAVTEPSGLNEPDKTAALGQKWSWATPVASPPQTGSVQESAPPKGSPEVRARVAWRGTAFVWSHSATTSKLGIGADYQSAAYQQYTQSVAAILNYYLVDTKTLKWRMSVSPGASIELTNSGSTTQRNEWVLSDLPIANVVTVPLYAQKESLYQTGLLGALTTTVATSRYSYGAGERVTFSPRLLLMQQVPALGRGSVFLESVLFGAGVRYDGLISKAQVAVADDVQRVERRVVGGGATDVLSGGRLVPHALTASGFVFLSENLGSVPIQLVAGAFYRSGFLYDVSGASSSSATDNSRVPTAGFSGAITVFPVADIGLSVGYSNRTDLRGPSPNLFYAPNAQFTADLAVSLDAIYERFTGPARTVPFILF